MFGPLQSTWEFPHLSFLLHVALIRHYVCVNVCDTSGKVVSDSASSYTEPIPSVSIRISSSDDSDSLRLRVARNKVWASTTEDDYVVRRSFACKTQEAMIRI